LPFPDTRNCVAEPLWLGSYLWEVDKSVNTNCIGERLVELSEIPSYSLSPLGVDSYECASRTLRDELRRIGVRGSKQNVINFVTW
jgi:hypothetical protein